MTERIHTYTAQKQSLIIMSCYGSL